VESTNGSQGVISDAQGPLTIVRKITRVCHVEQESMHPHTQIAHGAPHYRPAPLVRIEPSARPKQIPFVTFAQTGLWRVSTTGPVSANLYVAMVCTTVWPKTNACNARFPNASWGRQPTRAPTPTTLLDAQIVQTNQQTQ